MDSLPSQSTAHPATSGRDTPDAPAFGDSLRLLRMARGLTQEALAERSTISLRAISDLERGVKRRPQRETVRLLADALALSAKDRAAFESAARPGAAPIAQAATPLDNLFAPVTPLVGREREMAALTALLRRGDVRLVTVTGCGGVGKTRLSVDVAASLRPDFADGVVFVSLATIRDPDQVAAAVVATLGLKERPGESARACLAAYLRDRQLLLVLDNFEHVMDEALLVAELLAACPLLTV
ncbi:MAG: helix-turn-helix domain-containing protein, partial [Thermomicrobiales bacterium]